MWVTAEMGPRYLGFLINMLNWLSVQVNLTPPINLVNMLYWLSVSLINLTLPFLT